MGYASLEISDKFSDYSSFIRGSVKDEKKMYVYVLTLQKYLISILFLHRMISKIIFSDFIKAADNNNPCKLDEINT